MKQYDGKRIVWDIEICKNFSLLKNTDEIIIYGAGWKGKEVLRCLVEAGIHIECFCDMDRDKWETYVENYRVISPFKLQNIKVRSSGIIYVILCIDYPKEGLTLFREMGLNNIRTVSYWGIKMALYLNIKELYTKDSKTKMWLEIERSRRRNRFMETGFSFICDIIAAPSNAIWIVQPGKTATSTLETRLKEKKIPFLKIHRFEYPYHIGEINREVWERIISEYRKEGILKVVVAVREPLARDYSAFWQAFSGGNEMEMEAPFVSNDFQKNYECYQSMILKGSKYMERKLKDAYPYIWSDEFEWFDEQIKQYLDIDVFQYPFDREKGFTIIEKEKVQLLLYKTEKMDSILEEIGSFVGAESLSKVDDNISKQKWYGLAYLQFRKEVVLMKKYVEHYYCGNAKMDHFYTPEEKEKFLGKWEKIRD